jgi:hypothetical protein
MKPATPNAPWVRVEDGMPEEDHLVLVQVEAGGYHRESVFVGYWKRQSNGPMWVTPGADRSLGLGNGHRAVTHWCACLPNPLEAPAWPGTHGSNPTLPSAVYREPEASSVAAAMPGTVTYDLDEPGDWTRFVDRLPGRAQSCLRRHEGWRRKFGRAPPTTLRDLLGMNRAYLIQLPNLGAGTMRHIREALVEGGLPDLAE